MNSVIVIKKEQFCFTMQYKSVLQIRRGSMEPQEFEILSIKEALRMIVSIYRDCILILSYVKLLFYDLIDKISNSCAWN